MKDVNQSQKDLNIYKIYKLLKKIRIRIDREIRDSYTTNKKETKIKVRITKEKDISTDQEKDITIETDTIFQFEFFINYEDGRIRLYDDDCVIIRKRIIDIYVKKNDRDKIKLWNHEKENIDDRIRN